jgi:phosphopantothenoylcysteine decarboxylase/phosphopantothenate--cysteine ligase
MKILVTAGPTREPIDHVRFISNRSSGKMGYAVARAAALQGHSTVLISGPVSIPSPDKVEVVSVVTAEEMLAAVQKRIEGCDALVMAAAVCDWRPRSPCLHKIKKLEMSRILQLKPTPDILKAMRSRKGNRIFVGFAAETRDLLKEAKRKLAEKGLDLIVANDVGRPDSGFDVDTNQVTLIATDGQTEVLPLLPKDEVAERIINWIASRRQKRAP